MENVSDPTPTDRALGDRYGAIPIASPFIPAILPRWRHEVFDLLKTFIWFTIIPVNTAMNAAVPKDHYPNYEIRSEQYLWLPLTGLFNLTLVFGGAYFAAWCGLDHTLAALLAGFCYHMLFGHIHLEGLSDTVDALHAYPRKDPLTVLTEPYTGALGARYSGTANNLTSILLACLILLDLNRHSHLGYLGAAMVVAMVRIMPIYIVLKYYEGFHPGGAAAIGASTEDAKIRLRSFAMMALASMIVPTLLVCIYYADLRGTILYSTSVIAYFTAQFTVLRIMRYLKLVYGDILGAGIVCGEIAGLAILTMILAKLL